MLIGIAVVVFLLWLFGFTVVHLGDFIHIFIVIAIALVLWEFLVNSRNTR